MLLQEPQAQASDTDQIATGVAAKLDRWDWAIYLATTAGALVLCWWLQAA